MFDHIITGAAGPARKATMPIVVTTAAHVTLVVSLLLVSYVVGTDQLPGVPTMMTFVAPLPPPPLPPPPPAQAPAAPVQPAPKQARQVTRPATLTPPVERVPVLAPSDVGPEPSSAGDEAGVVEGRVESGVPGGVAVGIAGGVVGGFASNVVPPAPPPPPPPPSPASRAPVRIGGHRQAPALVKRVEPTYPPMARAARIEGLVILEALVNEDGLVDEVRVLRSGGVDGLLDRAALEAVRQWQYSPLMLNGDRQRFVLTVTLLFNL